ncbi:MAG TPA: hypothetical protein VFL82_13000 [Thermomicrobiales bacterium]|nr:hypothetical protein [Thermomicrobiales bacterium]
MTTPSRSAERLQELAQNVAEVSANTTEALIHLLEVVIEQRERAPVAARAIEALADATAQPSAAVLAEVAGAASNYAVLYQLLEQPEVLDALRQKDPLASARLRGLRVKEWLLGQEGGCLTAPGMAKAIGITRQAVDHRRRQGQLIGLDFGRRGYCYPAWQVDERGMLGGLPDVLQALSDYDPWTQAIFILNDNVWLDGERPLDALRHGQVPRVVAAARQYGTQSAA